MKRLTSACAVLVTALLIPTIAKADAISLVDPIIGVRGDEGFSLPVTDGSIQALDTCSGLTGFFCADYVNTLGVDLFAIDLSFWDTAGLPIPTDGGENYSPDPLSDLQNILSVGDFTIRLCDTSPAGEAACTFSPEIAVFFVVIDSSITPGEHFQVYSNVDGFVSVQGANLGNNNGPDPSKPIPEPGTLLLMGTGIATLAGRQFRRKGN
jgi:hypothetical protein